VDESIAHITPADTFGAMGTEVTLLVPAGTRTLVVERAIRSVRALFTREERRCSRFRPGSELSYVNARSGRWTRISPGLAEIVRIALDAAERTGGLFDPTVLPTLEAFGYDRDFDEIIAGARDVVRPAPPCGRWADVQVGSERVFLPREVRLDLGGIAKGWTADRAAAAALAAGLRWAVVNAGGDLRLAGRAPREGIVVALEDPDAPGHEMARAVLDEGAIATSSVTRRAWGPGRHHLIDPRTGAPATTGVRQATVWAPTCAEAEVASKVALLDGEASLASVCGLLVMDDGRVLTNLAAEDPSGAAA
jgi:thiamine biosynthesis lipoprotein